MARRKHRKPTPVYNLSPYEREKSGLGVIVAAIALGLAGGGALIAYDGDMGGEVMARLAPLAAKAGIYVESAPAVPEKG